MNKTVLKIVQISDVIQWHERGELELSPKYQRNSVWNDEAKSYLIDTILRGLPIPPIFLRQQTDINTRSTNREIIDGQQRIRAILEFIVEEKFAVKRSHNKEYGGKKYSDLDDDTRESLLCYEIAAEVIIEREESVIYDMFARLNSNNYILNRQEIRNSRYWGDFKVLVYSLASAYRDFFLTYEILSDKECTRMKDAELITSMIILLSEGIIDEKPAIVDKIYEKFDASFDEDGTIEDRLTSVMKIIAEVYDYLKGKLGCLSNKNYFFTFYAVIVNQMYGIKSLDIVRNEAFSHTMIEDNIYELCADCGNFLNDYAKYDSYNLPGGDIKSEWAEFWKNHKVKTTGKRERISRITFMNSYFTG